MPHAATQAASGAAAVTLAITPFGFTALLPHAHHIVTGPGYLSPTALFTPPDTMDALFVAGYQRTAACIAPRGPPPVLGAKHAKPSTSTSWERPDLSTAALTQRCRDLCHAHRNWKATSDYQTPVCENSWDAFVVTYRGVWVLLFLLLVAAWFY
jgi:hypothetical protein